MVGSLIQLAISIHAAREGGDKANDDKIIGDIISIHAAREGGDAVFRFVFIMQRNFNPRRP